MQISSFICGTKQRNGSGKADQVRHHLALNDTASAAVTAL